MQSSSREELSVFDSKEDNEFVESDPRGVSENSNPEKSSPTKLNFMGIFSHGSSILQQTEDNNGFCAEFDGNSGDQKRDDRGMFGVGASERDFSSQENFQMDNILVSTSMNTAVHAQINQGKFGPGNLAAGCLRMDSFGMESFTCGVTSHSKQLDCVLQVLPADQGKLVDVISDDDESLEGSTPSSTSLFAENRDGMEHLTPPFSEDHMEIENSTPASCEGYLESNGNMDVEVVVTPDFLFHGDKLSNSSQLTFSPNCIKLKYLNVCGSNEPACCQWSVDDILHIECQWSERVETGLVKIRLKPGSVTGEQIMHDIVKLTFGISDPQWHEMEQRILSMSARYKAIWNSMLEVGNQEDDFMGQNSMFLLKRFFASIDEPFEDVIYPQGDPDAVSVSKRDVELLRPETFINDTIIDFYIKYLKNKIQPEDRRKIHFFNSFFFRKLADLDKDPGSAKEGRAAFLRVRKWTRKINIFEKDYIFIPVNFNLHWSLIVVCHPGEVTSLKDEEIDKAPKVPCILHMDSIKGSHAGLKNLVQSYLWEEWKERHGESSEDVSLRFANLRFVHLELPQQENSFDCGLFLLHYVEMFLDEAPDNFNPFKITKFSNFLNADWFPHFEASHKRSVIQKIIFEILHDHSQKIPQAAFGSQNGSLKFQVTNAQKEHAVKFLSEGSSPTKNRDFGNSFCSTSSRGIEIELLTSSTPHGVQSDKEPEIIFREFLDSGDMAGACLAAQCGTYQEQEDVETNVHILCSSPDRVDYKQQNEMAAEPGLPLDDDSHEEIRGPEINVSLPEDIQKQPRRHEPGDASLELLSSGTHNLLEVRDDSHAMPIQDGDLEGSDEVAAETDEKLRSAVPDTSVCEPENADLTSGIRLDSHAVEDTLDRNAVSVCNENQDHLHLSQQNHQNHPPPSHQDVETTENNMPVEDTQEGNAVSESNENQGNLHLCQQNHRSPSHQHVDTTENNMPVKDTEGNAASESHENHGNLHVSQQNHQSLSYQDVETTEDNMPVEDTEEGNAASESNENRLEDTEEGNAASESNENRLEDTEGNAASESSENHLEDTEGNPASKSNENQGDLHLSQQGHSSTSHQDVVTTEDDMPVEDTEGNAASESNENQGNLHLSQQTHPSTSHQDVVTTEDNMPVEDTEGNAASEGNENQGNLHLSQQNHPSPSHQDVDTTENNKPLDDNGMQLSSEDLAEESKRLPEELKRPATKRLKLTPPEVGRRQTRSMARECQT